MFTLTFFLDEQLCGTQLSQHVKELYSQQKSLLNPMNRLKKT